MVMRLDIHMTTPSSFACAASERLVGWILRSCRQSATIATAERGEMAFFGELSGVSVVFLGVTT